MGILRDSDFLEIDIEEILSNEEKKVLQTFLKSFFNDIEQKHIIQERKIKVSFSEKPQEYIPGSIFINKLGVLEAIVKYLHENQQLSFKEISKILHRSPNNIAVSYKKSSTKFSKKFYKIDYSIKLPHSIFNKDFTCFESVCIYLKEKLDLNYHKIAVLTNRNDRTIWTIYNRAIKKRGALKSGISCTHSKGDSK